MEHSRRSFLKTGAGAATVAGTAALGGFPYFFVKDANAQGAPWVKKGGKINIKISLCSVTMPAIAESSH